VVELNLAEIVIPQKKASACGGGHRNDVPFTLGHKVRERRVIAKDEIHLPLEAARESLPATTQGSALGTNMMKNPVGEGEKDVH
jgi:hypothetical protein